MDTGIEWFEFENNVADELNNLSKSHEIIDVHYAVVSSSDWYTMAGGYSYVLVKAKKWEATKCSD